MTATSPRTELVHTLRGMVEVLDASHLDVAARIQLVLDAVEAAPPGDLPDRLLRRVHRLRQGTMGSLSDVVFAERREGRWVADVDRNERWAQLSRRLRDDIARLPPPTPPDLFLVSSRLRECWLLEPETASEPGWLVEVFPPVWSGPALTTDEVHLRPVGDGPSSADGVEVSIVSSDANDLGPRVLGSGHVFLSRTRADAAARDR